MDAIILAVSLLLFFIDFLFLVHDYNLVQNFFLSFSRFLISSFCLFSLFSRQVIQKAYLSVVAEVVVLVIASVLIMGCVLVLVLLKMTGFIWL